MHLQNNYVDDESFLLTLLIIVPIIEAPSRWLIKALWMADESAREGQTLRWLWNETFYDDKIDDSFNCCVIIEVKQTKSY